MGEPEATNLMDMPSNVRTNILKFYGPGNTMHGNTRRMVMF
jgi:hypothetical protein